MVITYEQLALAGWTGSMNGTGYGKASVNVTSSTAKSNTVGTASMQNPSAAMTNTATFFSGGPLPSGASTSTLARIKGSAGYVWKATTLATNGDKTDNAAIENRVFINPSACASLNMDSSSVLSSNGLSGTITVNAIATDGTALLLRGFEYFGATPPETADELEATGALKWDILMVGPFDLNSSNCTAIVIPFTTETGFSNLYFVADAVANSTPLTIVCPADVVVSCENSVVYQPVQYAGCGDITLNYDPPAGSSFPVGITPVKVTATDNSGNTTSCYFTVRVTDTTPPVVPSLATVTGQCSASVTAPTTTDNCAGTVTGTTSDPKVYNTQGTYTVHWIFSDGNGNTSTANQTVIVKDTTKPVAPVLATVTGSCSAPVTLTTPSATDNCAGTVTGTTTNSLVYNTAGTNVVYWTFTDGKGNTNTATQTVIVTGLTFQGFYSPIGTVNNPCTSPVIVNQGSVLPIKFDIYCGTSAITSGKAPTVKIQLWTGCGYVSEPISVAATYQNVWHYNWDTSPWAKGIYKVVVGLPDGTTRYAFVKIK